MSKTNMGFFGTLSGTVRNLTINANNIVEVSYSPISIGLFAGKCTGSIENCKATGNFSFSRMSTNSSSVVYYYVGGFCGELGGNIQKSKVQFDLFKVEGYRSSG